jgi:hypothetical protein
MSPQNKNRIFFANIGADQGRQLTDNMCFVEGEDKTFFNGIMSGDYIFPIHAGKVTKLWKLIQFEENVPEYSLFQDENIDIDVSVPEHDSSIPSNTRSYLVARFELIASYKPPVDVQTKFIFCEWFVPDINLIVKTSRPEKGLGFHRISMNQNYESMSPQKINFDVDRRVVKIKKQRSTLTHHLGPEEIIFVFSNVGSGYKYDVITIQTEKGSEPYKPLTNLYIDLNIKQTYSLEDQYKIAVSRAETDKVSFLKTVIDNLDNDRVTHVNNLLTFFDSLFTTNTLVQKDIGQGFARVTDIFDPALDVEELAIASAKVIDQISSDNRKGMVGIFGRWGRGKTYFVNELWRNSLKKPSKGRPIYHRVNFNAWKYQDTQASWAYLYETLATAYYNEGELKKENKEPKTFSSLKFNFAGKDSRLLITFTVYLLNLVSPKRARIITLNFKKNPKPIRRLYRGLWFSLLVRLSLFLIPMDGWQQIISWLVMAPILALFPWIMWSASKGAKALKLFHEYSKQTTFIELLGWQAEIQLELKNLLKTWIKDPEKERIFFFVDDIDRCHEDRIVELIDALRTMLDDTDIAERILVLTAIDERMMRRAIQYKYRHINDGDVNIPNDSSERRSEINGQIKEYFDKLFVFGIKLRPLSADDSETISTNVLNAIDPKFKTKVAESRKRIEEQLSETRSRYASNVESASTEIHSTNDAVSFAAHSTDETASTTKVLEDNTATISGDEGIDLIQSISGLDNATPRKIKILILKYVFSRELLDPSRKSSRAKLIMELLVYLENSNDPNVFGQIKHLLLSGEIPLVLKENEELEGITGIRGPNKLNDLLVKVQEEIDIDPHRFLNAIEAVNY